MTATSPQHKRVCRTLAVIGVGLLGGSIAAAVKQRGLADRVLGIGRNQQRLEKARAAGLIDDLSTDLGEAGRQAELVVVCTPVDRIVDHVRAACDGLTDRLQSDSSSGSTPIPAEPHQSTGSTDPTGSATEAASTGGPEFQLLLTDVGSVKGDICRQLSDGLPNQACFVGSHPLAGSEKSGFEHARPDLFEGAVCVVTPTESSSRQAVEQVTAFWQALGMEVVCLSPERHDAVLAQTSHLPHLVAAALASVVSEEHGPFAATGFADTTRIASGDPDLWTAILLRNVEAVVRELDRFGERVRAFRDALARRDEKALRQLLEQAKVRRETLTGRDTGRP